ncbi:MAG: bifunctional 4-hydroxy-2-oxoglutarate aldolase/2-dehydro-3-deoxy-phosphogluconate aldolase [Thermoguttaceae bacterium]
MMSADSVFQTMAESGVIPVLAIESAEAALPLADALLDGGLPVAEITFRTAAAAEVIDKLCRHRPEVLVGAGTVLSAANLEAAVACGARFGVAPGLNPQIVQQARRLGLPFIPGVCTASEVEEALDLDCRIVKFFPAELAGGVKMIEALWGPYAHTGVRFVPTGGATAGNLASYLRLPAVLAVGGTWIAKKDDLAGGRWAEIRQRCREAVEIVRRVRGA